MNVYELPLFNVPVDKFTRIVVDTVERVVSNYKPSFVSKVPRLWYSRVYCKSSENMTEVPNESVGLVFTSPPYEVGKEYDRGVSLAEYTSLLTRVSLEVFRVLKEGGRYLVNIANVGRRPCIPLTLVVYAICLRVGFTPMGEIIWYKKGKPTTGTAWGSWRSAKSPVLRSTHEYILVFAKRRCHRLDDGISTITATEFTNYTKALWAVKPESASRVGHPAPFPVELAARAIKLYSYLDDVVLDPFCGSGSTLVAAKILGRKYVGYDVNPKYVILSRRRLRSIPNTVW